MKKLFTLFLLLASTAFAENFYQVEAIGGQVSRVIEGTSYGTYYKISHFMIDKIIDNELCPEGHVVVAGNKFVRDYKFVGKKGVKSGCYERFFTLGIIWDSMKVFDVYDEQNHWLGSIGGYFYTDDAAEFYFYNDQSDIIARAVLNTDGSTLTVYDPNDEVLFTSEKHFEYNHQGFTYRWLVREMDNVTFDKRFLWPFVGFIAQVW